MELTALGGAGTIDEPPPLEQPEVESSSCCPGLWHPFNRQNQRIQPLSAPQDEVYIDIKPHRCIRVIYKPGDVYVNPFPELQGDLTSSDEDEYWFETASPKRPQIQKHYSGVKRDKKRIFHKFEPQAKRKIPGETPTSGYSSFGNRLQRKTIKINAEGDDAEGEAEETEAKFSSLDLNSVSRDQNVDATSDVVDAASPPQPTEQLEFDGVEALAKNAVGSALENNSGLILNITADSTRLKRKKYEIPTPDDEESDRPETPIKSGFRDEMSSPENFNGKTVIKVPDPESDTGSSSEDEAGEANGGDTKASVSLGGVANVGFESEEEEEETDDEDSVASTNKVHLEEDEEEADAGYSRKRDHKEVVKSPTPDPQEENVFVRNAKQRSSRKLKKVQKPLLFFIHGVGGSADSWAGQIKYFSDAGYECVATDLLGHGFSSAPDRPRAYTFRKLLRDTVTIFDHFTSVSVMNNGLSTPRHCVVIGHAYGASIGTALTRIRADNVKSLVMIACGGPTPLAPPKGLKSIPHSVTTCCLLPLIKCSGKLRLGKTTPTKRATSTAAASVAARRFRTNYLKNSLDVPTYVLNHVVMGQDWPEGDASYFRRVSVPTLLAYGLKDEVVSLVEMCEMERTIPKSYLELVPLAGHAVMHDQAKALNAMVKKFVQKYSL